ncbi:MULTISPECIES: DUF2059 domain-containing protein [Methylobacterium]|uniref:DUF2059 domain-containing protein n=1 Tax=Methylobacterium TaxID=407 RepID=UPI0013E9BC8E|nr:DUF2059 domain-containing protein [Methylobacterium sp. DB0501]NGM36451.1 DUF2059 domain-containing protein [Methylobacterium sp. DB0501]
MSPRRSRALLAGLLAATLASPALAQTKPASPAAPAAPQQAAITPSHLALAKEVMLSSGIARSFDSILPAFGEQIKQAAVTRPELTKDLNEVLEKMQPELELQKQRIIDIASRIYANKLTEAELRDIATFFRSPSGKRYVETQPQVLDDMVQAMQTWTQEVSEYMMVRVRAEMGKRGHQLQ